MSIGWGATAADPDGAGRDDVLPELSARLAVTQATDLSLMQLDEAAF